LEAWQGTSRTLTSIGAGEAVLPYRRDATQALQEREAVLSEISGFHGGDYKELRLLRCYAVWLL
jgi:hypothetical protein